ncbi:ankyrin [Gonapodya prolifera JEL478]|uniref:Ankyrin n=1 Tax=Gonapodya prolifera (strain JEL478) TaxID=1344416 RepID=A0A139AX72_GONPJ|nr:ankyrin [Gonapodya prolifera JEL478]|eukprot:KXS21307.1 ankyrin [Gonapodya prolifera JEL478]
MDMPTSAPQSRTFPLHSLPPEVFRLVARYWTDHPYGLPTAALSKSILRLSGDIADIASRAVRQAGGITDALLREVKVRGSRELIKRLLMMGADPTMKFPFSSNFWDRSWSHSAIDWAFRNQDIETVVVLLDTLPLDGLLNIKDPVGANIMESTSYTRIGGSFYLYMLNRGATLSLEHVGHILLMNQSDTIGVLKKKLDEAFLRQCAIAVVRRAAERWMGKHEMAVDTILTEFSDGSPDFLVDPLIIAVRSHNWNVVHTLIKHGAGVFLSDEQLMQVLAAYITEGLTSKTIDIIDFVAPDRKPEWLRSAILAAASVGKIKPIKFLLDHAAATATSTSPSSESGTTPSVDLLTRAAEKAITAGHDQATIVLVQRGADLDRAFGGRTRALATACDKGSKAVVQALLDLGCDADAPDADGYTVLARAARHGHIAIVRYLVRRGVSVDGPDGAKRPLQEAVRNHHANVAKVLLQGGADPEMKDCYGVSALDVAEELHLDKMKRMLLSVGAAPKSAYFLRK